MIALINQIIFFPFFIAVAISFGAFTVLYILLKKYYAKKNQQKISSDVARIAGENVWATKLDLARAYLEIGESTLAKNCILEVVKNGDASLKKEANVLLKACV